MIQTLTLTSQINSSDKFKNYDSSKAIYNATLTNSDGTKDFFVKIVCKKDSPYEDYFQYGADSIFNESTLMGDISEYAKYRSIKALVLPNKLFKLKPENLHVEFNKDVINFLESKEEFLSTVEEFVFYEKINLLPVDLENISDLLLIFEKLLEITLNLGCACYIDVDDIYMTESNHFYISRLCCTNDLNTDDIRDIFSEFLSSLSLFMKKLKDGKSDQI